MVLSREKQEMIDVQYRAARSRSDMRKKIEELETEIAYLKRDVANLKARIKTLEGKVG